MRVCRYEFVKIACTVVTKHDSIHVHFEVCKVCGHGKSVRRRLLTEYLRRDGALIVALRNSARKV